MDTVLVARDKYLKPNGMIFPDKATLVIAAIEDGEYRQDKIDCNFWLIVVWDNVYGFDMSCMKETVQKEPLVDTVNAKAIATDSCIFKEIDINTVTKEDLAFTADFSITAIRDDYVHAFVAYFDIFFNACHRSVQFSTGPQAEYTHWKQTVFYLKRDYITIKQGETIQGTLTCAPNNNNPRDLDISIEYSFDGAIGKIENEISHYRM